MLESWDPSQEEQWERVAAGAPERHLILFGCTQKNEQKWQRSEELRMLFWVKLCLLARCGVTCPQLQHIRGKDRRN